MSAGAERIRRATEEDAAALTRLAIAAKGHWGYPPEWLELWRDELEFTPASIRAQAVWVADDGGEPVGVTAVSFDGAHAEVEHLWVHPSAMGRGLGARLFHRAVSAARARGAIALVIVADPNAEGFYRRMGALPAGSVPSRPEGRVLPRLVLALSEER